MARSGPGAPGAACATAVGSVAPLLAGFASPGVVTVAVLVTDGTAAAPTATVSAICRLPPGPIGPGVVQVTCWPAALQVQPGPTALTKLSPAGRVSVTVTTPAVALPPTFWTVSVYA